MMVTVVASSGMDARASSEGIAKFAACMTDSMRSATVIIESSSTRAPESCTSSETRFSERTASSSSTTCSDSGVAIA